MNILPENYHNDTASQNDLQIIIETTHESIVVSYSPQEAMV